MAEDLENSELATQVSLYLSIGGGISLIVSLCSRKLNHDSNGAVETHLCPPQPSQSSSTALGHELQQETRSLPMEDINKPQATTHNASLPQTTPVFHLAQVSQDGCVSNSQYQFIKPDNFSHIATADVEFMKSQGAFQLPDMPSLDEFVKEYFRHVHPHLPLINEAAFWGIFYANRHNQHKTYRISLFTFQAMLFACCSVS